MSIPLTRYGRNEIIIAALAALALAILAWLLLPALNPWGQLIPALLFLAVLAFFRDPHRDIPAGDNLLLAPADGKVTDITQTTEDQFIHGPATRIGIFLSVADVHINRAPCPGRVAFQHRRHGRCFNALRLEKASAENEAHSVGLDCPQHPARRVLVRQITGAIARRIVADVAQDQPLAAGQRYGMIKFGSRTELFFPRDPQARILVKKGDTVRAGKTILVQYQSAT